ncbi:MAG: peroxiredoxin [Propionibacteriaceae bacterium]|jgi:peroxiredoxin Q/BCP|nr:peroxiredoxin [Propionibacteriaceae bacterium]
MSQLTPGDPAPDFALPDARGDRVTLGDFAPGKVIVYFYPAALTPGCTTEAVDFTTAAPAFARAGYRIVGISPDAPDKLARFEAKAGLDLTLLADPDKAVIRAYGAWGERLLYGKKVTGVIRSTFVLDVDAAGHATVAQAFYGVRAKGHVDRLQRDLLPTA